MRYNEPMNIKAIFKALDNDIRLQIMGWLKEPEKHFPPQGVHLPEGVVFPGGVCVGSICDKAGISQSTVSHYLDMLLQAGLLESRRAGKWTYYRRNEATIQAFATYIHEVL